MASRSKKKVIEIKKRQDANNISRKKWSNLSNLQIFTFLKIFMIVLIPIVYFVYSPLLLPCMVGYIFFYFYALKVEKKLNENSKQDKVISVPKIDSVIALIVICVSLFSSLFMFNPKEKTSSYNNPINSSSNVDEILNRNSATDVFFKKFGETLLHFSSLSTGVRDMISVNSDDLKFGMENVPMDFIPAVPMVPIPISQKLKFSKETAFLSSVPDSSSEEIILETPFTYLISTIISGISTVLIFMVSILGAFSIIYIYAKKNSKKYNEQETIVIEQKFRLNNSEIEKILSYEE